MADVWDETEEMGKRHQGNGSYLKLPNDGDSAVVVFIGKPVPKEVCYIDSKYVPFEEKHKAQGLSPSLRVAFRVALLSTREVKTFEQGYNFFRDVKEVRAKYGLDGWAFEVKRHGAAKDPKTTYKCLPERQLTAEEQKVFTALREAEAQRAPAPASNDPMQPLLTALKALPRESVERFCTHFRLKRVRDLPANQLEEATKFVQAITNELAPPPEEEIDPFGE